MDSSTGFSALDADPFIHFHKYLQAPVYHLALEALLIVWVLWLLFRKSYKPEPVLTESEKEQLIEEWQPEPLVPDVPEDHPALNPRIVTSKLGKRVTVDGKECLNLASHNYLGLLEHELLEERAIKSLHKYGVGSCGPRGFYGTVGKETTAFQSLADHRSICVLDIHLELENRLAKFMNVQEAVLYSYGFSAVASAIPAYSKNSDVIFADAGVHFAIQKGLTASRSKIVFFKHNDVDDLHRLLLQQEAEDRKDPKKAKVTRRFLVVEALYMNYGDLCPLPQILELKKKYKVRLFLDETVSFGVLGKTGRGITEYFDIPVEDIDHFSSTLEHAVSAYGGFCCGSTFIVDHQRLSGLGYCFSASLPPLQAACAIASIDILEQQPDLLQRLHANCEQMDSLLRQHDFIDVQAVSFSPVKHVRFARRSPDRAVETKRLEKVVDWAWNKALAVTVARYLEKEEFFCPEPSIRLTVNANLTSAEITDAITTLAQAFQSFL